MHMIMYVCAIYVQAGRALLRRAELEIFECPLHLEGGSIHSDGEGCTFLPLSFSLKWKSSNVACTWKMLHSL